VANRSSLQQKSFSKTAQEWTSEFANRKCAYSQRHILSYRYKNLLSPSRRLAL